MSTTRTESRYCLDTITARSRAMRETIGKARPLAHSVEPLLIQGEKGAGKTMLAKAIHNEGYRSEKPFVSLRSSMLTLDMLDKILFGDPATGMKGKLEEAAEGTLLIEGIESLSLIAQQKLLDVLRKGRFENCYREARNLSCRIIATANREELDRLVNRGLFLAELLTLLSTKTLDMPSLSERADDIPYLVTELLDSFSLREGIELPSVPYHYMELLTKVAWPGNVRQLRNHLESVMVLSRGEFEPAIILEHFEQRPASSGIKSALQTLWGRLRRNDASLAAGNAK
jgi:DNA-binding NtrC family response regulator